MNFAKGHPGAQDHDYREHRQHIAELVLSHQGLGSAPCIAYTEQEHELWRGLKSQLNVKHQENACQAFLDGAGILSLPDDEIPQLTDVSSKIHGITGFRMLPAVSLVPLDEFYGSLGKEIFAATQFIRHPSSPLFSPEPDMVHEVIGHGNALASKEIAELYRLVGEASARLTNRSALRLVSSVFWFCFEYGVIREGGRVTVLGASLLSSLAELNNFHDAQMIPLSVTEMATHQYDVTTYQTELFYAQSYHQFEDFVSEFYSTVDDETPRRLGLE
jgi:phenylalanine-4-hydroxylase